MTAERERVHDRRMVSVIRTQRSVLVPLGLVIPSLLLGSVALAGPLFQPNNTPIPQGNSLQVNGFNALGDPVNAINDAEITPPTFLPTCALEFTVHLRNAGYQNSFGWYNANGMAPAMEDLNQILDCNEPVGTNKIVDILGDPNYEGGEIGFFQAVGGCANVENPGTVIHVLYSEIEWNPDSDLMNPFIHLLIYQSISTPRTYYFAWEDLLQGGDNDFEDLFTSVSGIDCVGGGPCQPVAVPGDLDADLVCGDGDNCPDVANNDQADADGDLVGDACDPCPDDPDPQCMEGGTSSDTGTDDLMSESGTETMDGTSTGDGDGDGDGDTMTTTATDTNTGDGDGDTATEDDTVTGDGDGDTVTGDGDTATGDSASESGGDNGDDGMDEIGDDTGGTGNDSLGGGEVGEEDGCNCSTTSSSGGWAISGLLGLGLLGLRRRRY